jgi:hypothetical protein
MLRLRSRHWEQMFFSQVRHLLPAALLMHLLQLLRACIDCLAASFATFDSQGVSSLHHDISSDVKLA